jgi:predicted dehydrogenase
MNLTAEEKAIGKENFYNAIGSDLTRRDFLKGTIAAGVVSGAGLGAMYFKYSKVDNPVRIGVIGTGDEGGVLLGALTPDYVQVAAIADIRPYNVHRAFHGDWSSDNAIKVRTGLMKKYGWKTEDEAKKNVRVFGDYNELIEANKDLQLDGVIIALPLHLHAPVAIKCMRSGLNVITEKLMGYSVPACKEMGRVSHETGKLLATGHQRHYSVLYDNAVDCIRQGLIGDMHCIRAQWHRKADTWSPPIPSIAGTTKAMALADLQRQLEKAPNAEKDAITKAIAKFRADLGENDAKLANNWVAMKTRLDNAAPKDIDNLQKNLAQIEMQMRDADVKAENFGYQSKTLADGEAISPLEELIRWRLWQRTGGGLMAELGSHQLDASGIFVSAIDPNREKALPLSVQAFGNQYLKRRECEDHVYCMYEFPKPGYYGDAKKTQVKDPNKKLVVTYSSINGNGFGDYGEVVMGDKGTLVLLQEKEVMLYKDADTKTTVGVVKGKPGGVALDTTESGSAAAAVGKLALESGPPSRGYTEEIEHWAWCIRNPSPENLPKCHPKVALGDAVIALTTNIALRNPEKQSRIDFKHEWFDIDSDETPEGVKPDVNKAEYKV